MPYSSFIFDDIIEDIIKLISPKVFLDLGAGAGKYGLLVKKINPFIKAIAVEVEKDYLEKFNLNSIYHEIWNISAINLIESKYFDIHFDIVMAGDILEHLKKSEGIDLLNFLIYRSRWVIVKFPYRYLQNAVGGYNSEAHISAWVEDDFLSFERTKMYTKDAQCLVVLRGYLENFISVEDVEFIIKKYEKQ